MRLFRVFEICEWVAEIINYCNCKAWRIIYERGALPV